MDMKNLPFNITTWSQIPPIEHKGAAGTAHWRTQQFNDIRVRLIECSPGYLDHH